MATEYYSLETEITFADYYICWKGDEMSEEYNVGDMVETAVFVGTKRIPMGRGRVVAVHSGYCDVDHCYPYAAPWIYGETNSSLKKTEIKEEKK